jgi:hypothetical protein
VEAITVGSYGRGYGYSTFSNYGSVVDILAPGEELETLASDQEGSTWIYSLTTGTSPASALVGGAAALYLSEYPDASPSSVSDGLKSAGRDKVSDAPAGTTTKTIWIGNVLSNKQANLKNWKGLANQKQQ